MTVDHEYSKYHRILSEYCYSNYFVKTFRCESSSICETVMLIALLTLLICSGHADADIPKSDFMWGVATAAYQIEGATAIDGRGPSIWDEFVKLPNKTKLGDDGDIADKSYYLYNVDTQLIKDLGVKYYRFSISWSRIFPEGIGQINQAGIDHYNAVIDSLLDAGIYPMVTLYHWDLPLALEKEYGGWLSSDMETFFARYAEVCFSEFGDRVKYWITVNEVHSALLPLVIVICILCNCCVLTYLPVQNTHLISLNTLYLLSLNTLYLLSLTTAPPCLPSLLTSLGVTCAPIAMDFRPQWLRVRCACSRAMLRQADLRPG
jgi:hypothetical protein